jgi:membrane associated rhomboid family serine protease
MFLPLSDDNPARHPPYVTYGLIGINLAVMLWLAMLRPTDQAREVIEHGFIPERLEQLSDADLVVEIALDPLLEDHELPPERFVPLDGRFVPPDHKPQADRVIQLPPAPAAILLTALTAMFLHGGWLHVAGNMWFLWIFGNNVEDRLGWFLYLGLYLVGGILGTMCHWAYDPHSTVPVIGASGAVAAVLGAYAVTFPHAKVRTLVFLVVVTMIEVPALVWLGLWFAGELATAAMAGKDLAVAVWAHIGGFVAGAALMPLLARVAPRHKTPWTEEIPEPVASPPYDGP